MDLSGVIRGIRSLVSRMLAQDTACLIVSLASVAGLVTEPTMAPDTVVKHGGGLSGWRRNDLRDGGATLGVSVPASPRAVICRIEQSCWTIVLSIWASAPNN